MDSLHQDVRQKEEDAPASSSPAMPTTKRSCEENSDCAVVDAAAATVVVCMECRTNRFQYVCPRCAFKSCSLQCCKAHKERLKCNGKRNRTAFCPIRRMNDATLQSDYHFLEDVCAQMETSQYKVKQQQLSSHSNNNNNNNNSNSNPYRKRPRQDGDNNDDKEHAIPPHPLLQQQQPPQQTTLHPQSAVVIPGRVAPACLWQQQSNQVHPKWRHFATLAWERYRIQILYMPSGMQRRLSNKSYIQQAQASSRTNNRNSKRNSNDNKDDKNIGLNATIVQKSVFYWTLEWKLHNPLPSPSSQNNDAIHQHRDNGDHNQSGTVTTCTVTAAAPTNNTMTSTSPVSELCSVGDALAQQVLHREKGEQDDKNKATAMSASSLEELYTVFIAMPNQQQQQQKQQQQQHHHGRRRLVYYRKVSMESTVAEALQDTRVIEYPTFEVVHHSRVDEFPQFIQTL